MAVKNAEATWNGNLREGKGRMKLGSGAWEGPFSFNTRFGEEVGANPEELIGAALAGCFSMFLSAQLTKAGFTADKIHTTAKVHLTDGPTVSLIELNCEAKVPGVSAEQFAELVDVSKKGCPISKALAAVPEVKVAAHLV
ncbi:MAG TPA: OsmC family peroxiredoxin [Thermoflexales bacterium]|nr:OsmC family peroxiredoxin [Thermoflexales bacterium]HQW36580.1 OsmC family peroxiredoxin [Thermoflexales bacterium]HQZ22303.1 OsmC family peroxiredoxin [Thermoflexales bacterium]HRA00002.1 OsmC family peroxiredoxin [Thermoflexales bacterium]